MTNYSLIHNVLLITGYLSITRERIDADAVDDAICEQVPTLLSLLRRRLHQQKIVLNFYKLVGLECYVWGLAAMTCFIAYCQWIKYK